MERNQIRVHLTSSSEYRKTVGGKNQPVVSTILLTA